MVANSSFAKSLRAEIVNVKGTCNANHRTGDSFFISCYVSGGLCGFFYHDLFPSSALCNAAESIPGHLLTSSYGSARIEPMPSP